ncbi:MAG: hypothetical protein WKF30_08980 [Pyrinomonadaceae bacterium]
MKFAPHRCASVPKTFRRSSSNGSKEQSLLGLSGSLEIEEAAVGPSRLRVAGQHRQLHNVVAKLAAYAEESAPITIEDVRRTLKQQVRGEHRAPERAARTRRRSANCISSKDLTSPARSASRRMSCCARPKR